MTEFLIVATAGTVLAALMVVWPLISSGRQARGHDDADAALYRDQLDELDRDVERGTITANDAEGAKAEIARRLIAATRRAKTAEALAPAPRQTSRLVAAAALALTPALAALLYLQVGNPGTPDQPLDERQAAARSELPSQEVAERMAASRRPAPPTLDPEYASLLERLEKIVASRPMDIQGRRLLARNLARSGRWVDARKAYDELITVLGENATAEDHADHAEAMIFSAVGYVSPEATKALEAALRMDPSQTMARYYAGFALRQAGRPADAVQLWQALLDEDRTSAEPRGTEWQTALAAVIAETSGTTVPGPTAEDVRNAETMTPEERQAMIASMVAGLEERLTDQGGEPEEWVRLINAYMQLGKAADARRIFDLSQDSLGEATARSFVREQALVMGLKLE